MRSTRFLRCILSPLLTSVGWVADTHHSYSKFRGVGDPSPHPTQRLRRLGADRVPVVRLPGTRFCTLELNSRPCDLRSDLPSRPSAVPAATLGEEPECSERHYHHCSTNGHSRSGRSASAWHLQ